ncbi:MAG: 3-deoxy-D-manno-octulosonic acid transferase [Nitrospirae bacterium]|nr:3-deoxy-D-manno-octulosonic acid transferase [Nitrospirota bacterium]
MELRGKWLRDKLGLFRLKAEGSSPIWVHAVSVGEVAASIPLINRLKAVYPGFPVIISTITDTGLKVALDRVPPDVEVIYMPFDISAILWRCLDRINPRLFIVIETEIWPNILRTAARRGVPALMLNGRLSEKSARGYSMVPGFTKTVLGCVSAFAMQSSADAERIEKIGAEKSRITVTGNFKFDMPDHNNIPTWAEVLTGPVIVAGSTHPGEEELIISALSVNLEFFKSLKLVLAPRHPARFGEVEALIRKSGVPFIKRSEIESGSRTAYEDKNIILLDSIGELSSVYGAADVALIGKSFLGVGGQNPLEPASWGKPIICGPHMENFPFMREFIEEGAAFQVEPTSLARMIRNLLMEPEKAAEAGEKARRLYLKNAGAVDRSLEIIKPYLK